MSMGRVLAFDDIMEIVTLHKGVPYENANSALYEVCLAWLREDKVERGRRGAEKRKKWIDLPEEVRGPIPEQGPVATRVERWRLQPSIK
jgi:hypothetical protein